VDTSGQPAASPGEGTVAKEPVADSTVPNKDAKEGDVKPKEGEIQPAVDVPPPNSWRASAREHWGKLPPEVRQEVARREAETEKVLSASAESRKFSQQFHQTVAPYANLIRAQNSTPLAAVQNLMGTAAALTTGTPEQKAAVVTNIIKSYGIDIAILDKVLAGAVGTDGKVSGQVPGLEEAIQRHLAPVSQFMTEVQQARQKRGQELQQSVAQEIDAFEKDPVNEFFRDVREDMADIMDLAAKRGQEMTMKQAYARAVAANPQISAIVSQRKAAAAAQAERSKNASKTISGTPRNDLNGSKQKTRREMLAEQLGGEQ